MDHNKVLEFSASIGEYHYYKSLWNPIPNQKLKCTHEGNNPFNMFAIKVCHDVKIAGHLPMEIRSDQQSICWTEVQFSLLK